MAERVDKMPGPKRTNNRYPWDEWFDGSVWELVQGKDFEMPTDSMRSVARSAAISRGLQIRVMARGDRVYVQAER